MNVCDIKAKKVEVEKAITQMLSELQEQTGCEVSQVNVWETQIAGDEGKPIKSIAVQILLKL